MTSVDYFSKYFTEEGLDFPALINDDFMQPVRLLFNHGHYVSATKLLLVCVDSIGYIEYGESEPNPFVRWLDGYADLSALGVSAEELWEHRNSLLHMSNLDSRKVVSGKVRRLMCYVGTLPDGMPAEDATGKYFSLYGLILAVAHGCQRWFESYNSDRDKIVNFVARYDLIASDARMLSFRIPDQVSG